MNLTGFSICIIAQVSDRIFRFMHFRQSHVVSFSGFLDTMLGVLLVGSERREDKNKEI